MPRTKPTTAALKEERHEQQEAHKILELESTSCQTLEHRMDLPPIIQDWWSESTWASSNDNQPECHSFFDRYIRIFLTDHESSDVPVDIHLWFDNCLKIHKPNSISRHILSFLTPEDQMRTSSIMDIIIHRWLTSTTTSTMAEEAKPCPDPRAREEVQTLQALLTSYGSLANVKQELERLKRLELAQDIMNHEDLDVHDFVMTTNVRSTIQMIQHDSALGQILIQGLYKELGMYHNFMQDVNVIKQLNNFPSMVSKTDDESKDRLKIDRLLAMGFSHPPKEKEDPVDEPLDTLQQLRRYKNLVRIFMGKHQQAETCEPLDHHRDHHQVDSAQEQMKSIPINTSTLVQNIGILTQQLDSLEHAVSISNTIETKLLRQVQTQMGQNIQLGSFIVKVMDLMFHSQHADWQSLSTLSALELAVVERLKTSREALVPLRTNVHQPEEEIIVTTGARESESMESRLQKVQCFWAQRFAPPNWYSRFQTMFSNYVDLLHASGVCQVSQRTLSPDMIEGFFTTFECTTTWFDSRWIRDELSQLNAPTYDLDLFLFLLVRLSLVKFDSQAGGTNDIAQILATFDYLERQDPFHCFPPPDTGVIKPALDPEHYTSNVTPTIIQKFISGVPSQDIDVLHPAIPHEVKKSPAKTPRPTTSPIRRRPVVHKSTLPPSPRKKKPPQVQTLVRVPTTSDHSIIMPMTPKQSRRASMMFSLPQEPRQQILPHEDEQQRAKVSAPSSSGRKDKSQYRFRHTSSSQQPNPRSNKPSAKHQLLSHLSTQLNAHSDMLSFLFYFYAKLGAPEASRMRHLPSFDTMVEAKRTITQAALLRFLKDHDVIPDLVSKGAVVDLVSGDRALEYDEFCYRLVLVSERASTHLRELELELERKQLKSLSDLYHSVESQSQPDMDVCQDLAMKLEELDLVLFQPDLMTLLQVRLKTFKKKTQVDWSVVQELYYLAYDQFHLNRERDIRHSRSQKKTKIDLKEQEQNIERFLTYVAKKASRKEIDNAVLN